MYALYICLDNTDIDKFLKYIESFNVTAHKSNKQGDSLDLRGSYYPDDCTVYYINGDKEEVKLCIDTWFTCEKQKFSLGGN